MRKGNRSLAPKKPAGGAIRGPPSARGRPVPAVVGKAVFIEFDTEPGRNYLLRRSFDLEHWDLIESIKGDGETKTRFFKVTKRQACKESLFGPNLDGQSGHQPCLFGPTLSIHRGGPCAAVPRIPRK